VSQSFSSFKVHYRSSVDGFGGAGHIRESPTKVARLEDYDYLEQSHGESEAAALHTSHTYYFCTAV